MCVECFSCHKKEGDYFGEIALVQKGTKRTAYIRAQTYCVVEKLTDDIFDDLIKEKHPVAYEKIMDTKKVLSDHVVVLQWSRSVNDVFF